MSSRDGGLASSQIDEADGLTERDVPAAVCQRLLDGEIVKLGISAFQAIVVEGKEGVTRTLEGDELIAQGHLTTQLLILRAVKRVFVVGTVIVVVAHHAEVEFRGEWGEMRSERYVCSVVGGLFEAAESQGWNGLCLNIPQLSVLIGPNGWQGLEIMLS